MCCKCSRNSHLSFFPSLFSPTRIGKRLIFAKPFEPSDGYLLAPGWRRRRRPHHWRFCRAPALEVLDTPVHAVHS